ncbi:hypothetical protein C8R45DRAFT_1083717 [Mycena sanguinolenta]|nr:hypothetical protein C8R45DRAFT_1083717 [Mycena sanguinolenta]
MWSGSFTVFSGPTAGTCKKYLMSQELSKLDQKLVLDLIMDISAFTAAADAAQEVFANSIRRVTYADSTRGLSTKLALPESCSLFVLD